MCIMPRETRSVWGRLKCRKTPRASVVAIFFKLILVDLFYVTAVVATSVVAWTFRYLLDTLDP